MAESVSSVDALLNQAAADIIEELYGPGHWNISFSFQPTRKEFEGDRTLVVFPFLKASKKGPEDTGQEIGDLLKKKLPLVSGYNVVKGFLNISISDGYWLNWLKSEHGMKPVAPKKGPVLVEYSSPNTNKPLHLGHIRNNLLGYSVSEILRANGNEVQRVQIINDRGIHICKSMVAWLHFGNGETPESTGKKGDHLVGDYYVKFDQMFKSQVKVLVEGGMDPKEAEFEAPIMKEARDMLRKWEQGDPDTVNLWKTMNSWVYKGFDETYRELGVAFDRLYYESETYLPGKERVLKGLEEGVFYRKDDGSVWIDLTSDGLDEKLLIRSDGTSVYMTQDIGTAMLRQKDFPNLRRIIYTVGNEQNYHFNVLFLVLKKLGFTWADQCEHLSYGMVELPSGKMKSREGTVVDADDLLEEMFFTAKKKADELGKLEGLSEEEQQALFRTIGLGALKYFILRVDPKKQMVFNPLESIDFNGNTGPFIQYTHARIRTLLKKSEREKFNFDDSNVTLSSIEKELIKQLYLKNSMIETAGMELNPSVIANYCFELVKTYNQFYQSVPVLKEADENLLLMRLQLSEKIAVTIKECMALLGIEVPERM